MLQLTSEEYVGKHTNIRIVERSPQPDFPEHCHNFSELVLVRSGHGMHVVNGEQMVILPNTMTCISNHDYHLFCENNNVMLLNIMYNKDRLSLNSQTVDVIKNLESDSQGFVVNEFAFKKIYAIAEQIKNEHNLDDVYSNQMQSLLFEQLVLMIGRLSFNKYQQSPLINAIIYLCNHFKNHEISVHHVCSLFNVTQKSLGTKITEITGLSTNKFLNLLRIREAKLLLGKGQSVTEVAHLIGYNDSNYFSTKFKSITGVTPKQYMKN